MKQFYSFPALFPKHGYKGMSDGGMRLFLDTQELTEDQESSILGFKGGFITVAFAGERETINPEDIDIPDVKPEFATDKTPSQRLRGVMYRAWEAQGSKGEFELFYRLRMEDLINYLKGKYLQ